MCFPSTAKYDLNVPENHKVDETIGILELVDKDEIQNKEPIFTIQNLNSNIFNIEPNHNKDGNLVLKEVGDLCVNGRKRAITK